MEVLFQLLAPHVAESAYVCKCKGLAISRRGAVMMLLRCGWKGDGDGDGSGCCSGGRERGRGAGNIAQGEERLGSGLGL